MPAAWQMSEIVVSANPLLAIRTSADSMMWVLRALCFSGSTVRIAIPLPCGLGSPAPDFGRGHADRDQHRQPELGGADGVRIPSRRADSSRSWSLYSGRSRLARLATSQLLDRALGLSRHRRVTLLNAGLVGGGTMFSDDQRSGSRPPRTCSAGASSRRAGPAAALRKCRRRAGVGGAAAAEGDNHLRPPADEPRPTILGTRGL